MFIFRKVEALTWHAIIIPFANVLFRKETLEFVLKVMVISSISYKSIGHLIGDFLPFASVSKRVLVRSLSYGN